MTMRGDVDSQGPDPQRNGSAPDRTMTADSENCISDCLRDSAVRRRYQA